MFCSQCGNENQSTALFCQKCGSSISKESANGDISAKTQSVQVAIWNPNAAANWSLILSPAFSAYLQMLNWRALGESKKADSAQNWFYIGIGMLVIYVLIGIFASDPVVAEGAPRGLGFLFLLVWYFSAGREQGKYVKEKYGDTYTKKPWGKALAIGFGAFFGCFVIAAFIGALFGVAS